MRDRPARAGAGPPRAEAPTPLPHPVEASLPETFESERFILAFAREGDTATTLAARHLGDAGRAWMIEDYNGAASFTPGQEVMIPKRDWNLSGVEPGGYQIVPILVYHNLAPEAKGRMVLAAKSFEEQMRYLKAQNYRVVSLREFVEFARLGRQLPRRSVVLTFDDGYKAFKTHAHALLKELRFTATLFVYTDYVGAGRNSLSWPELRELAAEGFDVQAHSKSHGDLRRTAGEPDAQFARRMQAELELPRGAPQALSLAAGRVYRMLAIDTGRARPKTAADRRALIDFGGGRPLEWPNSASNLAFAPFASDGRRHRPRRGDRYG